MSRSRRDRKAERTDQAETVQTEPKKTWREKLEPPFMIQPVESAVEGVTSYCVYDDDDHVVQINIKEPDPSTNFVTLSGNGEVCSFPFTQLYEALKIGKRLTANPTKKCGACGNTFPKSTVTYGKCTDCALETFKAKVPVEAGDAVIFTKRVGWLVHGVVKGLNMIDKKVVIAEADETITEIPFRRAAKNICKVN